MCCLRYEHETYEDAIRNTPPVGSVVSTKEGNGTVIETKPLSAEIRVKLGDDEKAAPKLYKIADVKVLSRPSKRSQKSDDESETEE